MKLKHFRVKPGKRVKLSSFDPDFDGGYSEEELKKELEKNRKELGELQELLFSDGHWGVVFIFQGPDASKKDTTIKAVFTAVNPNGYSVVSYGAPTSRELDHDYSWRHFVDMVRRGRILVSNRSMYEEVLAVRVHPEFLDKQKLPEKTIGRGFWKRRFRQINDIERYYRENGFLVVKIFINASKKVRAKRLDARTRNRTKLVKFSLRDALEIQNDAKYRKAVEAMLSNTSTERSPWYVVSGNNKHFLRAASAFIAVKALKSLKLKHLRLTKQKRAEVKEARRILAEIIKGK